MNSIFEVQHNIRRILIEILESHSLEQLNKIPDGFSNNIIWNAAHCIAVQQSVVYKLSGISGTVSDEFITKYRGGTSPQENISQTEVNEIKKLLSTTLEQTVIDFEADRFSNYKEYKINFGAGYHLRNIQDALDFNNYHEGTHTGIIMSIRKFV